MADVGGAAVNSAAVLLNRRSEAGAVFERVKPPLVGKPKGPRACDKRIGRILGPFDGDTKFAASAKLLLQFVHMIPLGRDEVARQAVEIGVDPFIAADRLYAIDRRNLA